MTKISPTFRISICISSSLIFHGTGCTCETWSILNRMQTNTEKTKKWSSSKSLSSSATGGVNTSPAQQCPLFTCTHPLQPPTLARTLSTKSPNLSTLRACLSIFIYGETNKKIRARVKNGYGKTSKICLGTKDKHIKMHITQKLFNGFLPNLHQQTRRVLVHLFVYEVIVVQTQNCVS